jgi:taurine dioxygenase
VKAPHPGSPALVPLHDHVGVEVVGVDLARDVDEATFAGILDAFHRRGVLLLRNQRLTSDQQIAFSARFGTVVEHVMRQRLATHPQILVISNIFEDGQPIGLYENDVIEWHSDGSWSATPTMASFLYCLEAPGAGGETWFVSTAAAYHLLPGPLRDRIEGLSAVHSLDHATEAIRRQVPDRPPLTDEERAKAPPTVHPLVRRHPVTGRPCLYVGSLCVREVVGVGADEGRQLVEELVERSTAPELVYRHEWRAGDLVFWDNRSTMHTPTPCDRTRHHRLLHRTTVLEARDA